MHDLTAKKTATDPKNPPKEENWNQSFKEVIVTDAIRIFIDHKNNYSIAQESDTVYYITGGYDSFNSMVINQFYRAVVSEETHGHYLKFDLMKSFECARSGHSSLIFENKLYLIGGNKVSKNKFVPIESVECYDFDAKTWSV